MVGKISHIIFLCFSILIVSCNPFAPGLSDPSVGSTGSRGDQRTTDGVFQNLKYAYMSRDTTTYGQLFDNNFMFVYTDYDYGVDRWWGRSEEMRATYGLFENVQRLDLSWNDTIYTAVNADNTETTINRRFNLTVTFNPSYIVGVDGNAIFDMKRQRADDPWMIVRWKDESNY